MERTKSLAPSMRLGPYAIASEPGEVLNVALLMRRRIAVYRVAPAD